MPLDTQAILAESRAMAGPLGAIAFTVLKGLAAGGANAKIVAGARTLMQEHFSRLSDGDCNALCDLILARLSEDRRPGKPWYGA